MPSEVTRWSCGDCSKIYESKTEALRCEAIHKEDAEPFLVITKGAIKGLDLGQLTANQCVAVLKEHITKRRAELKNLSRYYPGRRSMQHICKDPLFSKKDHICQECEYWEMEKYRINTPG